MKACVVVDLKSCNPSKNTTNEINGPGHVLIPIEEATEWESKSQDFERDREREREITLLERKKKGEKKCLRKNIKIERKKERRNING